jgi:hypothetical protein
MKAVNPNKSLKGVRIRSLDSPNRRMLRILRAACVCPLALRYAQNIPKEKGMPRASIIFSLVVVSLLSSSNIFAKDAISPEIQSLINEANKGNSEAQFKVGSAYDTGNGAPRNGSEAMKWYLMAANNGNAEAQNSVGSGLQADEKFEEARGWYEKAAAQNHALATNNLAYFYDMGLSVKQDRNKGAELYLKSANLGWAEAMWNLANMYGAGQLGKKDMYSACIWSLRANKYAEPNNESLLQQLKGIRQYLKKNMPSQDFEKCNLESEKWSPKK